MREHTMKTRYKYGSHLTTMSEVITHNIKISDKRFLITTTAPGTLSQQIMLSTDMSSTTETTTSSKKMKARTSNQRLKTQFTRCTILYYKKNETMHFLVATTTTNVHKGNKKVT